MVDHKKQLSVFAEKFKNADPPLYEQFLRHLDAYMTELTVAVTEAPTDEILVAKGRAQQARAFWRIMSEFPKPNAPSP